VNGLKAYITKYLEGTAILSTAWGIPRGGKKPANRGFHWDDCPAGRTQGREGRPPPNRGQKKVDEVRIDTKNYRKGRSSKKSQKEKKKTSSSRKRNTKTGQRPNMVAVDKIGGKRGIT